MSGFLATQSPPTPATEPAVDNDPWYPTIALSDLRDACRIDASVTPARMRAALIDTMLTVNGELSGFQIERQAQGHATLAAVPAGQIAGDSVLCHHYRRAIHAGVQAYLTEAYREIETTALRDSRPHGDKPGDRISDKADEHRRAMRWAISDLLGRSRVTSELI